MMAWVRNECKAANVTDKNDAESVSQSAREMLLDVQAIVMALEKGLKSESKRPGHRRLQTDIEAKIHRLETQRIDERPGFPDFRDYVHEESPTALLSELTNLAHHVGKMDAQSDDNDESDDDELSFSSTDSPTTAKDIPSVWISSEGLIPPENEPFTPRRGHGSRA